MVDRWSVDLFLITTLPTKARLSSGGCRFDEHRRLEARRRLEAALAAMGPI
jgi:hypothetical protein